MSTNRDYLGEAKFLLTIQGIDEGQVHDALILIKNVRLECIKRGIDPRAQRIAYKFMLLCDDYASQRVLTPKQEKALSMIARAYFMNMEK